MASLTIENVAKVFGDSRVVDDFSIEITDGEFLVLVGPSGCGKSTTLRMIAGLEGIDGGTIDIGGTVVNDLHPADRDVAMVFQSYALYPHMSVYDNIAYGLKRHGVPRAEIESRVTTVTEMLKLQELLRRRPGQLSGGQRQRVALGRAIVRKPAVFLMDEPLSNLDAKLRVEMRGELSRLHASLGVTTVYVTHDQVEAMTMGDRIVVMNDGRIEQIGTPAEVYNAPASLFVARFLGLPEINIIPGHFAGDGTTFTAADVAMNFPADIGASASGDVLLGLRPQALFGSPDSDVGAEAHRIGEATVTAVEHHGPESFADCRLGEVELTVQVNPAAPVRIGTKLAIGADLSSPHFFSPGTGRRISR